MISQFFVLSQRGDNIVFRDYRGEVQKGSAEIFFRKVKFWKGDEGEDAPPVFNADGVNYVHVKVAGLLFVATTRVNVSPSLVLELLQRIARVIKDYLGVLNEDSLRKNFVLVYELLDEVIDFGYPQTTSTEVLKSYIFNEPIEVEAARLPPLGPAAMFMQGTKRMPGTAVTKSVVANEPGGRKREEIFVDIIEKISVTFSSSGYILTSEIDGTIQMKSYLTGNPEIRLALNEDLIIGRNGSSVYDYRNSAGAGAVILDDCNFHESVHLDNFDLDRTLMLVPTDGEFSVMNYRMTQEFKPPFRVNALIEEAGSLKAEVILKIRADFAPSITANTISVHMPLPKYATRVSFELEPGAVGNTTDFKEASKKLEWGLKKDCWWIRTYSAGKAHIFTGVTCQYHERSWTCEHDLHNSNVQCFKASGKVLANSKEIQDIQSIPVGEIRYTSKFLCCSNMINLHLFFPLSCVISHECRSTLLANIMIGTNVVR